MTDKQVQRKIINRLMYAEIRVVMLEEMIEDLRDEVRKLKKKGGGK